MLFVGPFPFLIELVSSLLTDRRLPDSDRSLVQLAGAIVPKSELPAESNDRLVGRVDGHGFDRIGGKAADAPLIANTFAALFALKADSASRCNAASLMAISLRRCQYASVFSFVGGRAVAFGPAPTLVSNA